VLTCEYRHNISDNIYIVAYDIHNHLRTFNGATTKDCVNYKLNNNKFHISVFVITVALLIIVLGILSQDIQRVQALMNSVEDCQAITKVKKSGHYTMQCCDVPDLNSNGRIGPDDEIAGMHMPDCSRYDCTVGKQGECKPIKSEAAPITPALGTVLPLQKNSADTQGRNGTSLIK
jgi:hypothetical protein